MKKVAVGLSGGVDSSVAAAMLVLDGYEVTGVYIEAYNEPGCRADQDKKDALKVALRLGIPFETLDVRREYRQKVIEYFYREYKNGRTPNPDIVCNREIKFGIFYDLMRERGFDFVATGHYARIKKIKLDATNEEEGDVAFWLQRARDSKKDQSYFLWQVPPEKLTRVLFPLGGLTKKEVRAKAREFGLVTADKPDSMGVCMMGQLSMRELLKKELGELQGEVIYRGEVVGRHKGLWFYTIGERRGIELDKRKMKKLGMEPEKLPPLYVIDKILEENKLVIGTKEGVRQDEVRVRDLFLRQARGGGKLYVRIRNLGELGEIEAIRGEVIKTREKMEGVAEGQSAVIYQDIGQAGEEIVVGGGEIG